MVITANFVLFADLYMSIKNPFFSQETRANREFSLLCVSFLPIYLLFQRGLSHIVYDYKGIRDIINGILIIMMLILSTISIIGFMIRLKMSMTSSELKKKVIGRNFMLFILFISILIESITQTIRATDGI